MKASMSGRTKQGHEYTAHMMRGAGQLRREAQPTASGKSVLGPKSDVGNLLGRMRDRVKTHRSVRRRGEA